MVWQRQPTKGIVKSVYQQQFADWVNGVSTLSTVQNNNNSYYGLQTYLQLNGSLENIFSLEGETRFNMVGMARGLASATTETHSPLVNIQIHHKPNQTVMPTTLAAYVTGANWLMKTVRDGGDSTAAVTAGTSGNLVSEWNVASIIQSNSFNTPTAGRGHDVSALVGIAQALGIGYRGGTQNSNALAYGLYVEAETLSVYGQGLNEIKVTNSSGTTAAHWYDATSYARKTVGLQIVADRDYSNGLGAAGLSRNNAVGLWLRTANNANTTAAFYAGVAFEQNSYSEVGIDFQFGGTSAFPILFGNDQLIGVRNPAASANLNMFKMDANANLDLFFGTSGTTQQDIQFMSQGGVVAAAVTPSGVWRASNTTSSTAPFVTVTNTGASTVSQGAVFSLGAAGQPNAAAVTDWLKVLKGSSVRYLQAYT